MSDKHEVDLALGILDHQLVDCEGRRCGKVDDLELDGLRDGDLRVSAIVTGPAAWAGRGWIGSLLARIVGGRVVNVAWDEVADVRSAVHLKRPARELRLGRGDERLRPWVEKLPGAER